MGSGFESPSVSVPWLVPMLLCLNGEATFSVCPNLLSSLGICSYLWYNPPKWGCFPSYLGPK